MSEVKQTFSFDCSQALASIQQFNSATNSMGQSLTALAGKLQSFNGGASATVSTLRGIASAANSTARALSKLAQAQTSGAKPNTSILPAGATENITKATQQAQAAFVGVGQSAQQTAQSVTVSWATIGRVVSTQLIVRALSQIRNAFHDAIDGSVQFQNAVAEIGTIAGQDFGGTGGIAAKVREISDAFNVPLDTAAKGYYETLSNNIDKATQAEAFMADASKFAKAAVTSEANSVNLLTAAINGYGLSANQAGDVAGKMFETIRVGRVRADDLANSIGRVFNVTKEAGISLEEGLGAIATMSTTGMKPAESITALRSATTAFLKPSEEMAAKLKELGFDSGPAALQTLGLRNAFLQLNQSVNGSADGMARLFPNVRGLVAAMSLSGTQADKFKSFTATIQNAGSALNEEKFAQVMGSPGQKLTGELNKLKNALTVDLGGALVDSANRMLGWVGGANTLIEASKGIAPVIATTGAALGVYALAAGSAAAANKLLGGSFGPIGKGALAVGAAVGVGKLLGDAINGYADSSLRKLEEANAIELAQVKAAAAEKLKIAQQTADERANIILAGMQKAGQAYNTAVAQAKEADAEIVASAKSAGDRIIHARQAIIDGLSRAIDQSRQIQQESESRVTGLQDKSADRQFQFSTRHLSDARKFSEYMQHSSDLAKQAAKQLQSASQTGDTKGIASAVAKFGAAQHYGEQADQIAQRLGNRRAENDAMSQLTKLTNQQVAAERQLSAIQEKRQGELDAERTAQQGILDTIKKNVATVVETSTAFDEQGNPLAADKLAANNQKRQQALVNIIKAGNKTHDLSLADSLGLARLATDLTKTPIKLAYDNEKSTSELKANLNSFFQTYRASLKFDVSALEKTLGHALANPSQITKAYTEAREEAAKLRNAGSQSGNDTARAAGLRKELADIQASSNGSFRSGFRSITGFVNSDAQPAIAALDSFKQHFAQVSAAAKITDADIASLLAELGKVKDLSSREKAGGLFGVIANQKDIEQYSLGLGKLKQLQGLEGTGANPQRLQQLEQATGTSAENARRLQTAASQANEAFAAAAESTAAMAGNLERAAEAQQMAGRMAEPMPERAFGGPIPLHFATGGMARGIDRIPAMLAPGEFVMNARSARAFGAQLTAMNANPSYRANGGAVTTIGDIHVNVNGGQTAQQSARQIAHGIRRELRRNTVKI